jgi:phosphoglycerate dehydrogenase-like enzyme
MISILLDVPLESASYDRLQKLQGVTVHALPPHPSGEEMTPRLLHGVQVLLCKRPPANFEDLARLELMQLTTVGYEHLRHLHLDERPIRVCNARGVFDTAIGEWNIAMMIALARDLRRMIRQQEEGVFRKEDRFEQEIRGRVVGLWGYGGIGRETARLARAFGMTVHVLTRSGVGPRRDTYCLPGTGDPDGVLPHRVFRVGRELDFLSSLDFLVLALPQTQRTVGLVGARELNALPQTAFVLNPARGPIIQEQALLTALREGWIAGAALDTHYAYPLPAEHPLWSFPNVILTPHISGADHSRLFPPRMGDLFVQNVERYLADRPLLNLVSPEEWREA